MMASLRTNTMFMAVTSLVAVAVVDATFPSMHGGCPRVDKVVLPLSTNKLDTSGGMLGQALGAASAALEQIALMQGQAGLSVGVVVDQQLVWQKGFGTLDPTNPSSAPVSSDTAFRIGSISKVC
jgi:CubicO group peptidase (beta-lactamase class C family)